MKNIFISSTFRDMQAERDMVQERVVPYLREAARKHGDNLEVIDLRWGVDTSNLESEEGSAKVLEVCLDEIDRSHPYMLIFIGERYGWIPDDKLIRKAVENRGDRYSTKEYAKSVTALEIEYGALSKDYGQLDQCIVCFRDDVSKMLEGEAAKKYVDHYDTEDELKEAQNKLKELKARIRSDIKDPRRLIEYSVQFDSKKQKIEEFLVGDRKLEEVLVDTYLDMFHDDWIEHAKKSWQEREQLLFNSLMKQKLRSFAGRKDELEDYYNKIVNEHRSIILQGQSGSGKTAFMCKLIERLQLEGKNVFYFFSGVGTNSNTVEDLKMQMVYYMEDLTMNEHVKCEDYDSADQRLKELCDSTYEQVYFFIDGIDQLFYDEFLEQWDFFFYTENIQMIVSCLDTFEIHYNIRLDMSEDLLIEEITPLKEEDAPAVVSRIFSSQTRETFEKVAVEIMKRSSIKLPLYIFTLIQRLNMMDEDELNNADTDEKIVTLATKTIKDMPEDLGAASVKVLEDARDKIGDANGTLEFTVNLIAISQYGLRIVDIKKICEEQGRALDVLDLTLLFKYMDIFFYERQDGRIDFTHKAIRQGLLNEMSDKVEYATILKNFVRELDPMDTFRLQEGMHLAHLSRDAVFAKELIEQLWTWLDEIEAKQVEECWDDDVLPISYNFLILHREIRRAIMTDEGIFCGEVIAQEKEVDSIVCRYLYTGLSFLKTKKEMPVEINICVKLEEYYRGLFEKKESFEALYNLLAVLDTLRIDYDYLGDEEKRDDYKDKINYYYIDLDFTDVTEENYMDIANLYSSSPSHDGFFDEISKTNRLLKAEKLFLKYTNHEILNDEEVDLARKIYFELSGNEVTTTSIDDTIKAAMYALEQQRRTLDVASEITLSGIAMHYANYFIGRMFFMDEMDKQVILGLLEDFISMVMYQSLDLIEENICIREMGVNLTFIGNMLSMERIDDCYDDYTKTNEILQEAMKRMMDFTGLDNYQQNVETMTDWEEKSKEYVKVRTGLKEKGFDSIRCSNALDLKVRESLKRILMGLQLIGQEQDDPQNTSFVMRAIWAELLDMVNEKELAEKQYITLNYNPGIVRALMREKKYQEAYEQSIALAEEFDTTDMSAEEIIIWMRCKICAANALYDMKEKRKYLSELKEIVDTIEPYVETEELPNVCMEHYAAVLRDLMHAQTFREPYTEKKIYKNKWKAFVSKHSSVGIADLTYLLP